MNSGPDALLHLSRQLGLLSGAETADDATLLGRFISDRDEGAFAALVRRHSPMVLRVCQRVLGNEYDAEDSFQATFLVLARKAATVQPRDSLAAWLHGVARRVALKARSVRIRHLRDARPRATTPGGASPDPLDDLSARELLTLVDEEIQHLPRVYRLPVILCCLEGFTQEEVSRRLGWTPGTVRGCLERGRARLHARLVRRGLTLSAVLVAAELSQRVAPAGALDQLCVATTRAALAFAAKHTSQPAQIPPEGGAARAVALA
jgi:RNA polymerase sigma factor (sigma-70 family)